MTKYYLTLILVRVVLPAGLLTSIALRPYGLSFVYLLLFLLSPSAQVPDQHTSKQWRGKFLLLTTVISFLLLLLHTIWHSWLAIFQPYGSLLINYPFINTIGANLGLVSYKDIDQMMAVHLVAPELVSCGTSLLVYLTMKRLVQPQSTDKIERTHSNHQKYPHLTTFGRYVCLILIMCSGIMRPSITSAVYYLVFIGAATAWALGRPLEKGFAVVCRCLMALMAVHIIVLMIYQCTWIVDIYPPNKNFARYIGLTKLVSINVTEPGFIYEATQNRLWANLANPFVILLTYLILAIECRELFKPKARKKVALTGVEAGKQNGSLVRGLSFRRVSKRAPVEKWKSASRKARVAYRYINSQALRGGYVESAPLMQSLSPNKRLSGPHQDSSGSIIVPDEDATDDDPQRGFLDEIIEAIIDFFQVLIRSSYIATTITMMAWSIMFHSWLTFVFLMWANIVWLCQNQRSVMLKSSPVLVLYAVLLLLAQYVYGMDLTEQELPSNITHVNLQQIGLGRPITEPFTPLLVKSLFTCMFWVTLRQRINDIRQKKQTAVLTDMAAPLQLTVSTAASVIETQHEEETRSRLLLKLGEWLRALAARYWIYVVVIMLFIIGITGERMTMFRIIYMFLFLGFVLMFQISWYWWRRLMYIFWIVVIFYSMINLILLYVYQFDNFPMIIEKYLLINVRLQHDLGLEPYHPADLFLKLLAPTLFLIMTIMQVHYFHKDFMAMSSRKTRASSIKSRNQGEESKAASQAGASTMKDDLPALSEDEPRAKGVDDSIAEVEIDMDNETTLSQSTRRHSRSHKRVRSHSYRRSSTEPHSAAIKKLILQSHRASKEFIAKWIEKVFMYLEIHLIKIAFISCMLLCVVNVSAMHVPIMVLITPVLWLRSRAKRFVLICISTLISFYFMTKMIYQIDYIKHSTFDVNCTYLNENNTLVSKTYNNAEWVGFVKATHQKPLLTLVKGYIGVLSLFTFYFIIIYRQEALRARTGQKHKGTIMFPEITRKEADIDLAHCIKYFFNYGFYKFGVEITLICLMGAIGSRMDVYAVFYAVWLLAMVSVSRKTLARIWFPFTACVTVLIPLQYMIAVGFLPQFCIRYLWEGENEQMKHIRTWLFLPYPPNPPHPYKLVFDYLALMFASRQMRVFRVEAEMGENYPGGSNSEDIGKDWETPNFVNPVPDFLSYVGSWLDVFKRMVFLGMLWVTLAIMFMTGTNRVNLFSMGYLVGSFIFLWQGTDYYLRPKESIMLWWSWLLRYNVTVVVVKTLLQIPGCIFSSMMQEHSCWLVQLLGIGCVDKFAGGNIARYFKMQYVKDAACSVPQEDIGLAWDGVCFTFLIMQRRLFHSYYFYRVIDESKATTVLASRGAELIEQLRLKQMNVQEDQETKILEKIKVKMERIKENQKKIQRSVTGKGRGEDEEETMAGESEQVALVRGESASTRGYHTPDSPASPRGFHTPRSEASAPPSPARPSPSSALMTVSLDAYLEPRRISFGSPPPSELLPRAPSPEESYPVFSPPPIRRRHTVASPSVLQRTSIISQSSRAEPQSHHTLWGSPSTHIVPTTHHMAVRSGDYYMFDEFDDTEIPMKDEESSSDEELPSRQLGFGSLMAQAIKTDLRRAVSLRRNSAPLIRSRPLSVEKPKSIHEGRSRRPLEADMPESDQEVEKPATVMDDEISIPPQETIVDKVKRYGDTALAFLSSILISITRHLMKYSRDYRYVSRTLSMEKKILKEKEGFGIGLREGSQMIWEPLPQLQQYRSLKPRKLSDISVPEIRILAPSMERGLDASPVLCRPPSSLSTDTTRHVDDNDDDTSEHESAFSLQPTESKDVSVLEDQDESMFKQERNSIVRLGFALWYLVLAHTDIACYLMVFINQIQSATILSIPLPLMVFMWGTLTIPRPTKTFWVTLIAYTEVIVLIKSMFQFEILPWNQKAIPTNMPFTAPRIIGIERKFNYALYDLLLLLIIFLHRFMLKSLGLWKESTPEVELRGDCEYPLTPQDIKLIGEGQSHEVGRKYVKLHDARGPSSNEGSQQREPSEIVAPTPENSPMRSLNEMNDDEEAGPSKLLQDDNYYDVNDDQEPIIAVTTTIEDTKTYYPNVIFLSIKRYLRPAQYFFNRMLVPGARVTADIYAYMFLCDFLNFLVVIFGFAAFGTHQGDGGVQAYLEENKVPIPFLVMLILQFTLIVIDRALYLRKYMLGKILFQYVLIIGVHIWMFFILPFITERTFNALLPPPLWYLLKCIYLLLSAYQIRCGYPRRIIGNFLCKSYRFLNMVLFRGFMAIPFLFELRALMDWIWTDTSMTLMDWLKMEDIFASVFLLKCSRYVETEFPQPRGAKKSNTSKYLLGGAVLAFVISIIWFPLVFFAFGNTVGQPNPPTDVTVKIRIGPFLPVFQMSAQSHNIDVFTEQDFTQLSNMYARDRSAQTFLSNYLFDDIAVVTINPNSTMNWEISPPELDRLEKEAQSNATLLVRFTYVITHPTNAVPNPPTIEDYREVPLEAFIDDTINPERVKLQQLLAGTAPPDTWLNVKTLFPKFVKVFNKGTVKPAYQLMPVPPFGSDENARLYRDVQLRLERTGNTMYWRVREYCSMRDPLATVPLNDCKMLIMYTFNDKLFPDTLNFISGSGIIGLYTTFVFLASRVLRGFFSGIYTKIMFDDLPNVDRVLQLCLDIYLVREALELTLEEDLFAKLVFLYRSPETMIKWTRPKEEQIDEQRALPPSR